MTTQPKFIIRIKLPSEAVWRYWSSKSPAHLSPSDADPYPKEVAEVVADYIRRGMGANTVGRGTVVEVVFAPGTEVA